MPGKYLPAVASAVAILIAVSAALLVPTGPLSAHMLLHVAVMNLAAPLAAIALMRTSSAQFDRITFLWVVTVLQIALLWGWHVPAAHRAAAESGSLAVILHASLFAAAIAFWTVLLSVTNRWQAIFSLLITGKFACLLGALLIFAPRPLYFAADSHRNHAVLSTLGDQQLAGLYMVAACPLSFVLAGIILAVQALGELARQPSPFER